MSKSSVQRVAVPITSVAVVAGMMLIGSPANAETTSTPFNSSCQAKSLVTVDKTVAASMTVDAPATVAPGEIFTYRIKPNASSYPNSDSGATTTNLSRLKYDYAIPANAEFQSAAVVGAGINIGGVTPNVLRVSEAGAVDNVAGPIVRLSGNNEVIGNGANNNLKAEGGILVPKNKKNIDGSANAGGDSWYQLPAVDITVKALAPGVITPKVRTAGSAANYGADQNFSTSLAKASVPVLGTQWAPTRCIPSDNKSALNAGAGALATITVAEAGPVVVDTATTLNAPATAKTGTAVDLTATVAPAGATGTVDFKDGATVLGTAPVNAGVATLNHTFTTDGSHSITAVYSGDATNRTSTSAASTVEVSTDPVIVDSTTTLNVPATAKTGTAVDLTATVAPAGATGTVDFKDGATVLGTAPVNAGVATLNHTFTTDGSHSI
ncbi:Ig-like domain-containing protein, partial [Rhodococcus sp. ARC_M6]|uniref:Ig-like domain-containing protein n=1 Tax=Rhodococcus sp. ARC_M6 TaxID=2928852 RepID=UPI001FB2B929